MPTLFFGMDDVDELLALTEPAPKSDPDSFKLPKMRAIEATEKDVAQLQQKQALKRRYADLHTAENSVWDLAPGVHTVQSGWELSHPEALKGRVIAGFSTHPALHEFGGRVLDVAPIRGERGHHQALIRDMHGKQVWHRLNGAEALLVRKEQPRPPGRGHSPHEPFPLVPKEPPAPKRPPSHNAALGPVKPVHQPDGSISLPPGVISMEGSTHPVHPDSFLPPEPGDALSRGLFALEEEGYQSMDQELGQGGTREIMLVKHGEKYYAAKIFNPEKIFDNMMQHLYGQNDEHGNLIEHWTLNPKVTEALVGVKRKWVNEQVAMLKQREQATRPMLEKQGFHPLQQIKNAKLGRLGILLYELLPKKAMPYTEALQKYPFLKNDPVLKDFHTRVTKYDPLYEKHVNLGYYGETTQYYGADNQIYNQGLDMKVKSDTPYENAFLIPKENERGEVVGVEKVVLPDWI
jgi:hypothetical protein